MSTSDFLLGVGTVTGGALLTILIESLRGFLERQRRIQDRHEEFQRETLLDLHLSLHQLVRALYNAMTNYQHVVKDQPPLNWPPEEDPRSLGAGASDRILMLTARIEDKELRRLVKLYRDSHTALFATEQTTDQFYKALDQLSKVREDASERIGLLLRDL
jgi:hypothetical protein